MRLKEIGEFGLIDLIAKKFGGYSHSSVTGIGDDCAIIPGKEDTSGLVTCDTLIESIHFQRNRISPEDLGYKSLAVNISDIAAMGGKAEYAFLSLALPGDTSLKWINRYLDGLHELARKEGVALLGGDTTRTPEHITITITLIGSVDKQNVRRRSDARPGDLICVTGYLGDSGAGLQLLLENKAVDDEHAWKLVHAHNHPVIYHTEGQWLASQQGVHAMIDISDGLSSDALHIAKASGVTMAIEMEMLPLSESLLKVSEKYGWDIQKTAVSAGEDYVLLCTADPGHFDRLQQDYQEKFGSGLFEIGKVTKGEPATIFFDKGEKIAVQAGGYDHFR